MGGLFVAGVCALTPDMGACLDGAMGKETKRRSTSPSNRTLSLEHGFAVGIRRLAPVGRRSLTMAV